MSSNPTFIIARRYLLGNLAALRVPEMERGTKLLNNHEVLDPRRPKETTESDQTRLG